jgi:hypothetical protein
MNSLILLILFPIKLLKKTRIDNFVGGLIFGAVFSLFVNIATVKVQEDINRQRVLESIERELVQQSLNANNAIIEENQALDSKDEKLASTVTLGRSYPTRIWDNLEASKYIFELPSVTAGKIESHYSLFPDMVNNHITAVKLEFDTLYKGCNITIDQVINNEKFRPTKDCNDIARSAFYINNVFNSSIIKQVDEIRATFHPTQNRVNSWWLSILLGKYIHPVMEWSPEKSTIFTPPVN